jgi:hypothetical protein
MSGAALQAGDCHAVLAMPYFYYKTKTPAGKPTDASNY